MIDQSIIIISLQDRQKELNSYITEIDKEIKSQETILLSITDIESEDYKKVKALISELENDKKVKSDFLTNYVNHVTWDIHQNELDYQEFCNNHEKYIKKCKEFFKSELLTLEQKRALKDLISTYESSKKWRSAFAFIDLWRKLKAQVNMTSNYLNYKRNKSKFTVNQIMSI